MSNTKTLVRDDSVDNTYDYSKNNSKNESYDYSKDNSKNESYDYSKNNKQRNTEDDPKYAKFYSSVAWKRFRQQAFIKHGIYCVYCLEHYKRYTVADTIHHKVEVRVDFTKRFDMDNVMPVCSSCHNKIHEDIKSGATKKVKPKKPYAVTI